MKVFKDKANPKDSDQFPFVGEEVMSLEDYLEYAKKNNLPWGIIFRILYVELHMKYEEIDKIEERYNGKFHL